MIPRRMLGLLLIAALLFALPGMLAPARAQADCATPLALTLGGQAQVTIGGGANRVRRDPGLSAEQITLVPEGATFTITGGPICVDGYNWWTVTLPIDGTTGWMAEGTPGDYWMEPAGGLPDAAAGAGSDASATGLGAGEGEAVPLGEEPSGAGPLAPGGGLPEGGPVSTEPDNQGGGADADQIAADTGLSPLPGPPDAAPAGLAPLALLTVDPDGTLGLYRDGRGWLAEGSVDGNAQRPTFLRSAGRLLILRVANERLEALDPDTGQAVIALNWTALTGQPDLYFYGAYPSPDNSAALAFVFQRSEAFAPYGLFRVDLSTQAIEELLPVGSWASLQGPPGDPPRYVLTPTAIVALQADGRLGAEVLSYPQVPTFSEAPFLPDLTWSSDGRTAYVAMPAARPDGGSDFAVWRLGADASVVELLRITGADLTSATQARVSPDGQHLALQLVNVGPNLQEWRIYALATGAIEGRFPADFFGITWTPDSRGFIARRSSNVPGEDGFAYYGLDGGTASPYLPGWPGLIELSYLPDGTILFRQMSSTSQSQVAVQRPGQPAYSVRLNSQATAATLGF